MSRYTKLLREHHEGHNRLVTSADYNTAIDRLAERIEDLEGFRGVAFSPSARAGRGELSVLVASTTCDAAKAAPSVFEGLPVSLEIHVEPFRGGMSRSALPSDQRVGQSRIPLNRLIDRLRARARARA